MKTYKLKGLNYYITDCRNSIHPLKSFLHHRIGVVFENIEEYEGEIPTNSNIMIAI